MLLFNTLLHKLNDFIFHGCWDSTSDIGPGTLRSFHIYILDFNINMCRGVQVPDLLANLCRSCCVYCLLLCHLALIVLVVIYAESVIILVIQMVMAAYLMFNVYYTLGVYKPLSTCLAQPHHCNMLCHMTFLSLSRSLA